MTLSKFFDLLNKDCEVHFVANLIENGLPVDMRFTYKKPDDIDTASCISFVSSQLSEICFSK